LSFDIALSELFLRAHCSAIHSPRGTAHLGNNDRRSCLAWAQIHRRFYDKIIAAAHNAKSEILFSSTNSNLHCLQIGTRSFYARFDIDPVGVEPLPTSELPP
jgi:hypothetical protein